MIDQRNLQKINEYIQLAQQKSQQENNLESGHTSKPNYDNYLEKVKTARQQIEREGVSINNESGLQITFSNISFDTLTIPSQVQHYGLVSLGLDDKYIFNQCTFKGLRVSNLSNHGIQFNRCTDFGNILSIRGAKKIELSDCSVKNFQYYTTAAFQSLEIVRTDINEIELSHVAQDTNKGTLMLDYFYFDTDSLLTGQNKINGYKKLQKVFSDLGDNLQARQVYFKLVNSLKKEKKLAPIDELVFNIKKFVGADGVSFWRPLIILGAVNGISAISIFCIDIHDINQIDFLFNILNFNVLDSLMNYGTDTDFSTASKVIDSTRRILIPVFVYILGSLFVPLRFKNLK